MSALVSLYVVEIFIINLGGKQSTLWILTPSFPILAEEGKTELR